MFTIIGTMFTGIANPIPLQEYCLFTKNRKNHFMHHCAPAVHFRHFNRLK